MAGNPADLSFNRDTDVSHDHTYYGNGCPDKDGSITPCSTRIVKTADDENQKNGTYYHFQATTVGTGGTMETSNTNAPDSFCPLGWQLPYSGTGGDYYDKSKSWRYLFVTYSITFDPGTPIGEAEIRSYPFSYILSGRYRWAAGALYYQGNDGGYWPSTIDNGTTSYHLDTGNSTIHPADKANKTNGITVRCVKILASFHRRHGGRR